VKSRIRYAAVLATALAALAVACSDATAPRQDSVCSGGGTQGWDLTCTTSVHVDTAVVTSH
jgi:hypothetical protein